MEAVVSLASKRFPVLEKYIEETDHVDFSYFVDFYGEKLDNNFLDARAMEGVCSSRFENYAKRLKKIGQNEKVAKLGFGIWTELHDPEDNYTINTERHLLFKWYSSIVSLIWGLFCASFLLF